MRDWRRSIRYAALVPCLAAWSGCSREVPGPPEGATTPAPPPATAQPSAAQPEADAHPTASAQVPTPKEPRTFAWRQAFAGVRPGPLGLRQIEGAVLVYAGLEVGRIDGGRIAWLGKLPLSKEEAVLHTIVDVGGRWPDLVYALAENALLRDPAPRFWPIAGNARPLRPCGGQGGCRIAGVARVDGSWMVAGTRLGSGPSLERVAGPELKRKPKSWKEVCGDAPPPAFFPRKDAIRRTLLVGSGDGTLFSLGVKCKELVVHAEIWPAGGGPSRLVSTGDALPTSLFSAKAYAGPGDRIWIDPGGGGRIVAHHAGTFSALPATPKPHRVAFVGPGRALHASDGHTLWRLKNDAWKRVGDLDWSGPVDAMATDGARYWAGVRGRVFELVDGPGDRFVAGCKTPLVHLSDVGTRAPDTATFPGTRKALRVFSAKAKVELVAFEQHGKRLGVKVPDEATGRALVAHAKKTLPDATPRLMCFAPKAARAIPL